MSGTFRKQFFPQATARDWQDWQWQLSHAFRTRAQLERVFTLTEDERAAFAQTAKPFPLSITPYYASLMNPADPHDPLRLTMVPRGQEHRLGTGEFWDPLGEDAHTPARGIVHTYPDKVLFFATDFCATYCRYCTRARVVGSGKLTAPNATWEEGLRYIAEHPAIRDVLVTGGDPLTLADARLDWLLTRLRAIPHVQILRIGTKLPAVLPQRLTPALVRMLRRHAPLWLSLHVTHPNELAPAMQRACNRAADAGLPMVSQTVLLKGVNDDTATLKRLFEGLVALRVMPYYLHQCDPIVGSAHFRTPVATGQQIIRELHGRTTGFAIPTLMLDAPGGGGKVPIGPSFIEGRDGAELLLRNYEGRIYRYHDPA
ncbi:MAG: KamA family radical SAM protein [Lentisphaerae bacterium]|nr:KamA family radical SAM protein [Lentisphaerota bacterium]